MIVFLFSALKRKDFRHFISLFTLFDKNLKLKLSITYVTF